MPRPQFTLRALLVAMLVVGAFFGGIRFERERQRREDEAARLEAERLAKLRYRPFFQNAVTGLSDPKGVLLKSQDESEDW